MPGCYSRGPEPDGRDVQGAESLDVLWVLLCATLVMLMQVGFSALESGLVRSKNSINVAAKNFTDFLVSATIYWLFGFALMLTISARLPSSSQT